MTVEAETCVPLPEATLRPRTEQAALGGARRGLPRTPPLCCRTRIAVKWLRGSGRLGGGSFLAPGGGTALSPSRRPEPTPWPPCTSRGPHYVAMSPRRPTGKPTCRSRVVVRAVFARLERIKPVWKRMARDWGECPAGIPLESGVVAT